jgi:hypothetical protein
MSFFVRRFWTILFLLIGGVALAWMIRAIGVGAITDGLLSVGWGFVPVLGLQLVTLWLDAASIRLCAGDAGRAISTWPYLRAGLAGHAINQVIPAQVGEVTRYVMLRGRIPAADLASAIVLQNLIWFLVNCVLVGIMPVVAVAIYDIEGPVRTAFLASAAVSGAAGVVTVLVMIAGVGDWPFRVMTLVRVRPATVEKARTFWHKVDEAARAVARRRGVFAAAVAMTLLGKALSGAQNALILYYLGLPHDLALGLVSLAGTQVTFMLTSFVPMHIGTAEGGAYLLFKALGMPPEWGVLMELVRRLRRMAYVAIGVAVLAIASATNPRSPPPPQQDPAG